MQHHDNTPLLFVILTPFISAGMTIGRETIARLLAYVGADYLLARFIKHEEVQHPQVRATIDKFLDD